VSREIAAAGIYRDPVRSSHGHFVKVRGLLWISLHLLVSIPWAGRVWALPFLTALGFYFQLRTTQTYVVKEYSAENPFTSVGTSTLGDAAPGTPAA
jgi:hypothetical protein